MVPAQDRHVAIRPRWAGHDWAVQALVAAAYFFGGKLGLLVVYDHLLAAPVWPTAGLALAAVLLLGYRVWPGLIAGAFLLNLTALGGATHNLFILLAASLCMASGEALQALVAAWLVETYAGGRDALRQPRTIALFVAMAAVGCSAISATSTTFTASLAGLVPARDVIDLWASSWLGDVVGVVLVAPLLLIWWGRSFPKLSLHRAVEAIALLLLLVLACDLTFGPWHGGKFRGIALSCLIIPILLWTAFRFGAGGTVVVTFIFGGLAIAGTWFGHGPFVVGDRHASFLLAQNVLTAIAFMSLLLAAEVAQRRRIDEGLRASEQRYRDLFDYNPQPMWVFDYGTLRFLAVNQAAIQHYGYSREEFLAMTITDIRPPEDVPSLLALLDQARQGRAVSPWHRHRKKDGTHIDVQVSRHNLVFDGREAAMILATDITERKQAQERAAAFSELGRRLSATRTPKEATRIIVETANALFGWSACRLELGPASSGLMETVYAAETVNGRLSEVPTALTKPSQMTALALQQGAQISTVETTQVTGPMTAAPVAMAVPVRTENHVLGVLSLLSDPGRSYTPQTLKVFQALADHCGAALERIRTETALRESEQRLSLALAASRMGIWTMELQDRPRITSSPELEAIFGLEANEFDGSKAALLALIHPEDRPLVRSTIAQAAQTEGEYEIEFRILPRNRALGWVLARGCSCFNARGEPTRLVGVAFDISARKAAEEEILRLNLDLERRVAQRTNELEATNRELESFSYSVSHDLRAPLRSIRGFSEVLLERYGAKLDARGREFLRRACESSQQMDLLIEDLLKLSRVGRAELHHQDVNLSALARAIAEQLRAAHPQRAIEFLIAPDLQACGDERLLRIALENLLRNAWKFTAQQAKPRIEFGQTANPTRAYFVRDNGAGFDMAYAGRLFGVFQRLHSAADFPGTGIGLATVKRILNRHGGQAWAEGVVDHGATFYFTLPHNRAGKNAAADCTPNGSSAIVQEQVAA